MEKKFEKLFEKENVEELLKLIKKYFEKDDEELLLENIEYIEILCGMIKQKNWVFSKDIVEIILENMNNKSWHVRQDLIILLGTLTELFPKEFIRFDLDPIINKLKEIFVSDDDEDNRYHALQVIGKIGLLVPNKCLQFLINQLYDPNPKIQIYSINALTEITKQHIGEVKEILPFLTESLEKENIDPFVVPILEESIKNISEYLYDEKITDFMMTEQISCPYCKEFYPAKSDVCTNCGKEVAKCQICGQKLQHETDMKRCPYCRIIHCDASLNWQVHSECER
ncbi:MAG: HEAT repeat domain-containing protein, partial [Promethearchaeota archaeon]